MTSSLCFVSKTASRRQKKNRYPLHLLKMLFLPVTSIKCNYHRLRLPFSAWDFEQLVIFDIFLYESANNLLTTTVCKAILVDIHSFRYRSNRLHRKNPTDFYSRLIVGRSPKNARAQAS